MTEQDHGTIHKKINSGSTEEFIGTHDNGFAGG